MEEASMEVMDTTTAAQVATPEKEVNLRRLPILMKWKISKEALEQVIAAEAVEDVTKSSHDKVRKSLFSRYCHVELNLPNFFRGQRDAYGLTIYPNGKDDKTKGEVWLTMHMTFTSDNWNRKCKFSVTIPSNGYSQNFEHEYYYGENLDGEEWEHRLCTTEELFNPANKYFDDCGWMYVNVDGSFEDEVDDVYLIYKSDDEVMELWKDDTEKDFTVIVGDKAIKAHKHVLVKQSRVFDTAGNKLEMNDFTFKIVEGGIKLCYGISFTGSLEDVISVYQFAETYELEKIAELIDVELAGEVSLSTVCELANIGFKHKMKLLYDKCCRYLTRCVKKTVPVLNLDKLDNFIAAMIFKDAFRQYRCTPEDDDFDSLASEKSSEYDSDEDMEDGHGGAGDGCRQM